MNKPKMGQSVIFVNEWGDHEPAVILKVYEDDAEKKVALLVHGLYDDRRVVGVRQDVKTHGRKTWHWPDW